MGSLAANGWPNETPGIGETSDTWRVRRDISHTAKRAGRDDDGKRNLHPDSEPDNDPGRQSRDEPST